MEGRQDELVDGLRAEMQQAAERQEFERAAHLRDAIRTVETLGAWRNKLEAPSPGDRDVFGLKAGPSGGVVEVFQMRRGRVADRVELVTDPMREHGQLLQAGDMGERALLETALQQFYADRVAAPEVHTAIALASEEANALEAWLSERAGRRVRVLTPKRGDKRGLLDLAMRNAAMAYHAHFGDAGVTAFEALETLRVLLALPALPRRIECFDISTFQGRETVASMVVAVEGRMKKAEYRKFRIKGPALDDFAAMQEVVVRRYQRVLEQGGPFPDLIVIDGGKGQLSAAYAALEELGLANLVAVGIAKKEELLFTRDRDDGLRLAESDPGLLLIERVRDEAHRFAVTFHRRARTMRDLRSDLDRIPHIGPRRRRLLLTTFGSVTGVRRATREELTGVVGAKAADRVLAFFGAEP